MARDSGNQALGSTVLTNLLQDFERKLQKSAGQSQESRQRVRDDRAKVKLAIYENEFNQAQPIKQ